MFEFNDTTYCKPLVYCIVAFLATSWSLEVKQTVGRFERSQPADRHVQQFIEPSTLHSEDHLILRGHYFRSSQKAKLLRVRSHNFTPWYQATATNIVLP